MTLKIIGNKANLIINLPILEEEFSKETDIKALPSSKYRFNTISFKDKFSLYQGLRSEEEYQEIWGSMGSPSDFTIDDMKWIDLNLHKDMK